VRLTASDVRDATQGVLHGDADARASSFTIDTRTLEPGGCFFALRAARDGLDFVPDAFARGAALAVVDHRGPSSVSERPLVEVDDPMAALADCARLARARLADTTVVGITGSAGKTATKDLTAAALTSTLRVHASPGSFNNEAGLPLTLLGAPEDTQVVVTEMGARFAGNITELTDLARPSIGVVTHVGMAHAQHLGGRAGIARVKGELMDALPADGLAVLNAACDATPGLAARTRARVVLVGSAAGTDVRISDVRVDDDLVPRCTLSTPWGTGAVRIGLRGAHQVENAAMAATVALALGAPFDAVAAGLEGATTASRRMELLRTATGVVVINDAYNSSPTSAAAAVRSLASLPVPGRRIAVLGEMLELGDAGPAEHRAIGMLAGEWGIDIVVAVQVQELAAGAAASGAEPRHAPDADAATALLLDLLEPGDAVLVKASRAIGLERVAEALVAAALEERTG
jgi:UDP-N-acetylmuramoyl-tripeptide--D-alanyl-D-alanine ligase